MAVLTPATVAPHFDEAANKLPLSSSSEALSSRIPRKQLVALPHSKQNASFGLCERPSSSAWRLSAVAASAPQTRMPVRVVERESDTIDECDEQEEAVVAEGRLFDWNSQWYPVSLTDDLDKRVPTAVTVLGRHLVVSWVQTEGSWQVCDEVVSERTISVMSDYSRHERDAQSIPTHGSLKCRAQSAHAPVYPSLEQDGLLWFWPDTRPEFENIAERKLPPSIPALTDPAFKDKLFSLNLPYGYKKMIENFLEPACLPFAHDEPEGDFFEDFEESLTSTANQLLSKPISGHSYHTELKQAPYSKGSAHEGRKFDLLGDKVVMNNKLSHGQMNGIVGSTPGQGTSSNRTTNGSYKTLLETPRRNAINGASGSSNGVRQRINGFGHLKGTLYEAKQSTGLDSSTDFQSRTGSDGIEAEDDSLRKSAVARSGNGNADLPNGYAVWQEGEGGDTYEILSSKNPVNWAVDGVSPQNPAEESINERGSGSIGDGSKELKAQSSVLIKKPLSSMKTKFEEKINAITDPSNTSSKSNSEIFISENSSASMVDLESSLQALRRMIFQKDYELAKSRVIELYRTFPRDTGVLMEYAFVEKQLGDLVAAGSLYSKAISAFQDQQNLGYDYVRALQALGSIETRARNVRRARVLFMESIRAAQQAEKRFPDLVEGASVYGLHAWAQLELQQGNWAKARDLLARAADIQPGNAVVHQSRALLEGRAHNWTEARHHFSRAVESAPGDVKCWHAWAIFEAQQQKVEKMRQLFQKALEVDPYSIHCLQAWAHQETLIGTPKSYDKARSLFQRCIQIDSGSLYAWQAWAVLEKNVGNCEKARQLFEKCLEINPCSVVCLQALANMERHVKNWGAAQRLLWKALKLEPENAAVLMEAAFVERSLGNPEVAERMFVLAGMADKRKSKITNRIFASRKEVMPWRVGRGRRGFLRGALKQRANSRKSVDVAMEVGQESNYLSKVARKPKLFEAAVGGSINKKQEEHDSQSIIQRQSSHRDDNHDTRHRGVTGANKVGEPEIKKKADERWLPSLHARQKKRPLANFQFAIDAIQSNLRANSAEDGPSQSRAAEKQITGSFQFAIDSIKVKQRELKNTERESSHYLIGGERGCTPDGLPEDKVLETEWSKRMPVKETTEQTPFSLKRAERMPSMVGA